MKDLKAWNLTRYQQKGTRYEFEFAGELVGSIKFGSGITIYLCDDFKTQIELWMPFSCEQYGQTLTFNPRGETTKLASLLELVAKRVVKAVVEKSGFLTLTFDNQLTLQAPSNSSEQIFEAWQISDRYGFQVICAIGGDLAIWLPNAETSRRRNKANNFDVT